MKDYEYIKWLETMPPVEHQFKPALMRIKTIDIMTGVPIIEKTEYCVGSYEYNTNNGITWHIQRNGNPIDIKTDEDNISTDFYYYYQSETDKSLTIRFVLAYALIEPEPENTDMHYRLQGFSGRGNCYITVSDKIPTEEEAVDILSCICDYVTSHKDIPHLFAPGGDEFQWLEIVSVRKNGITEKTEQLYHADNPEYKVKRFN